MDRLRKHAYSILKVKIAVGLEHAPRRTDIQRNKLGRRIAAGVARRFGVVHSRADDCFQLVRLEFEAVRAEGIGVDHIGARVKIIPVNGRDDLGVAQVPAFGMLAGLEPLFLQKRAHAAVQIDDVVLHVFSDIHGLSPVKAVWKRAECAVVHAAFAGFAVQTDDS